MIDGWKNASSAKDLASREATEREMKKLFQACSEMK